jgi:hypothetical protein
MDTADELERMADVIAALARKSQDFSFGLALAVGQLRVRAQELRKLSKENT